MSNPKRPGARMGRPGLGIVNRSLGLTPSDWEWLKTQRGPGETVPDVVRRLIARARALPWQMDKPPDLAQKP